MVSRQEEGHERRVLSLRHLSVCEQGWKCLTEVRPAAMMDWDFFRYVADDCEDDWMMVHSGTLIEA